ncbi:MAG: superinfection immunity protein [Neptuniibacter sp.]
MKSFLTEENEMLKAVGIISGLLLLVFAIAFVLFGSDPRAINGAVAIVLLFIGVIVYLLPSVIAVNRQHVSHKAIVALNILLGWSMLGWITAFIWACNSSSSQKHKQGWAVANEIEKLKELRDNGALSDDEFSAQKKLILEAKQQAS